MNNVLIVDTELNFEEDRKQNDYRFFVHLKVQERLSKVPIESVSQLVSHRDTVENTVNKLP